MSKGIKLIIYKGIVLSALLYGCETWAATAKDIHRLEVFHFKCLRSIRGVTLLDRISNDDMRDWSGMPQISDLLNYRRLNWAWSRGKDEERQATKTDDAWYYTKIWEIRQACQILE